MLSDQLVLLASERGRVATEPAAPELGAFYRSDHYEFAKRGIPVMYMTMGRHALGPATRDDLGRRYHTVSDEVLPQWNLAGAVADYRLYFELGFRVAEDTARPAWKAGDEFAR